MRAKVALTPTLKVLNKMPLGRTALIAKDGSFVVLYDASPYYTISLHFNAVVENPGQVGVVLDDLMKLSAVRGEAIIYSTEDKLYVEGSDVSLSISVFSDDGEGTKEVSYHATIPASELLKALKRTSFITKKDFWRVVECVFINNNEVVATDAVRLAIQSITPTNSKIYIPREVLPKLQELLKYADTVSFSSNSIAGFVKDNKVFEVFSSFEAPYPNYHEVIPTSFKHTYKVDRKKLLSALKPNKKTDEVFLTFKQTELLIRFSDDTRYTVPLETVSSDSEEFVVCFNPKYVEQVLSALDNAYIIIQANDSHKAVVFRTPSNDYMYELMPMRMKED